MNRTITALTAILLALALCAPTQAASQPDGSHWNHPYLIILSVHTAPYVAPPAVAPFDNPNYAYNIAAPSLGSHTTTTQSVSFSWCNHGTPAPYSHLVDVGTGGVWNNSLPVNSNQCQVTVAVYVNLQPGHDYNLDECEAYHGNCGGITPWIQ